MRFYKTIPCMLLLLPLRDNNLKEAKTLSDLFYHPNPQLQQAVVQEVTSNQGKGVAICLEFSMGRTGSQTIHLDLLDLSGNKLDGRACDLLAMVVPSMARLEVLWLSRNPIRSGGAVEVIKSLCGSGVKQLWLYNTGIGGPDSEAFSELLQSTHSFELYIEENNLSSESVASIITGLSHNSLTIILDISGTQFSTTKNTTLACHHY